MHLSRSEPVQSKLAVALSLLGDRAERERHALNSWLEAAAKILKLAQFFFLEGTHMRMTRSEVLHLPSTEILADLMAKALSAREITATQQYFCTAVQFAG